MIKNGQVSIIENAVSRELLNRRTLLYSKNYTAHNTKSNLNQSDIILSFLSTVKQLKSTFTEIPKKSYSTVIFHQFFKNLQARRSDENLTRTNFGHQCSPDSGTVRPIVRNRSSDTDRLVPIV